MGPRTNSKPGAFHGSALHQAVAALGPVLGGEEAHRNRVSQDIKALEAYLQSLPCQMPFRWFLGRDFDTALVPPIAAKPLHATVQGAAQGVALVLALGPNPKGKTRLFLEVSLDFPASDLGSPGRGANAPVERRYRECKPLIEHTWAVRAKVYPMLPEFLTALAKERQTTAHLVATLPKASQPTQQLSDSP